MAATSGDDLRQMNRPERPADAQPRQAADERTNAILWLGLAEGPTRDALIERLAQARLTELPAGRSGVERTTPPRDRRAGSREASRP
jgi:hypothetical protein